MDQRTKATKLLRTKYNYVPEELQYFKKTMLLNGYPKSFSEKEIEETSKDV